MQGLVRVVLPLWSKLPLSLLVGSIEVVCVTRNDHEAEAAYIHMGWKPHEIACHFTSIFSEASKNLMEASIWLPGRSQILLVHFKYKFLIWQLHLIWQSQPFQFLEIGQADTIACRESESLLSSQRLGAHTTIGLSWIVASTLADLHHDA